jgi:hypothetical protein
MTLALCPLVMEGYASRHLGLAACNASLSVVRLGQWCVDATVKNLALVFGH